MFLYIVLIIDFILFYISEIIILSLFLCLDYLLFYFDDSLLYLFFIDFNIKKINNSFYLIDPILIF